MEFGKELARGRVLVDEMKPTVDDVSDAHVDGEPPTPPALADELGDLAALSPRSIVIEAWLQLESAIFNSIRSDSEGQTPRRAGVVRAARTLVGEGALDDAGFEVLEILYSLRNNAVHEPLFEITTSEALDYAHLALELARKLRRH